MMPTLIDASNGHLPKMVKKKEKNNIKEWTIRCTTATYSQKSLKCVKLALAEKEETEIPKNDCIEENVSFNNCPKIIYW